MSYILSVAEKPSVAKELTAIIGKVNPDSIRRGGLSHFNPIFDIERCMFKEQPMKMKMTSVLGHMMELEFEPAYRSWHACSPQDLFDAPVKKEVRKDIENLKKQLIQEARKCSILLLWLDCDLEGENIAFEVIQVCKEGNPNLDIYRARFSALIERDILRTMRVPDRPNPHMNDAVNTRQEIDLRIGAAFTRFQTLRLQKKFADMKKVISYGPCQFPTLGFVVERDLAIKNFQAEPFWYITCEAEFPHPDGAPVGGRGGPTMTVNFNWERHRVYDEFAAIVIYESCFEDPMVGQQQPQQGQGLRTRAMVIKCQEKPTSRRRPCPLNTIDFQVFASRYLRMSSDRAMSVAEALYQRGILSYPRTETNFFKEGFELHALLQDHRQHSVWGNYTQALLDQPGRFEWPRPGGKDDQAHPPIHPTKYVELNTLENDEERAVYEFVTRHFLACCSKDAKGSQTTMTIQIPPPPMTPSSDGFSYIYSGNGGGVGMGSGGELFAATGLVVLERNYLDIYGKYEHWSGNNKLPNTPIGTIFTPSKLMLASGQTSPPDPLSESDLIQLMDRNGIGTDATIAQHIATIISREYVVKDNHNRFTASNLGLALVEGYNAMGYQLNKPQLRASIEADCQRVARNEMKGRDALKKCLELMKNCFIVCQREANKLDQAMEKYFAPIGTGGGADGGPLVYDVLHRNLSSCGICHEGMELRVERLTGSEQPNAIAKRILFCSTCRRGLVMPLRGDLHQHELSCLICSFQVLTVHNRETNKDHTICPFCFSNPPPPPEGVENVQEFRCFSCAKVECPLSGRTPGADVNICACIGQNCSGFMRIKKNSKGFIAACSISSCKSIWWTPKWLRSVIPQENQKCARCQRESGMSVCKLLLKVNLAQAPPGLEPEMIACPVCDPLWQTIGHNPLMNVRQNRMMPPPPPANRNMASYTTPQQPPPHQPQYQPQYQPQQPHMYQAPLQQQGMMRGGPVGGPSGSSTGFIPASNGYSSGPSAVAPSVEVIDIENIASSSYGSAGGGSHNSFVGRSGFVSATSNMGAPAIVTSHSRYGATNSYNSSTSYGGSSNSAMNSSHVSIDLTDLSSDSGNGNPNCHCGIPTKLLTVNKEGTNKGRPFYSCTKPKDGGSCNFFQWGDEPPKPSYMSTSSSVSSYGRSQQQGFSAPPSAAAANAPNCFCGEKSLCLKTMKEGENKDREFYACSKRREDPTRCKFFEWADGVGNNNSGGAFGGGGSGGRGYGNTGGGRSYGGRGGGFGANNYGRGGGSGGYGADVICSRCRQPGHYARGCPNS